MTANNDRPDRRFSQQDCPAVHLVVPIKPLHLAKSRLLGEGARRPEAHAELVMAVALDTVAAARRADGVAGIVVVTSDPALTAEFTAEGVEVLADLPAAGLNAALRHGDAALRARVARVGALQADLPALRPDDLGAAIRAAGADRSFCPDHHGTGTTLLLAEPGRPLDPRFGSGSADAHAGSGAKPLVGPWDSLRCDVDTEADLRAATALGLGPRTKAAIA
ncbi:2-phospho-L-lactate guanylyltransferase [Saccharopolyspora antimicrobica]|uniref:Phosphoenolpyruvate guanylyltransferase n=1 Tax=Saccharopolyspora antimicrobica TaxID=455193 RepID=A0A1I4T9G9_9PSEU|nr:2-phospho-L-lactate guanylyltransferase [Saccharopolyspora antimicrobica]RKT85809.1 2-phospho-L-lactate guanylyltransferase [Saccharopolyspora antimicrobica]SFM73251.1 2-phospho-L-lactate guanylyltransferase [Saccharopolyspora antimicrobica]